MATQTDADDGTDDKNTVQWKYEIRDCLLAEADTDHDEEAAAFLSRALEEVAETLATNHMRSDSGMPGLNASPNPENYEAVSEMIEGNVHSVELRKNGLGTPKVTVWLNEKPPMWGNTSGTTGFKFSTHGEHYNGKRASAIIDVRPF